MTKVKYKFIFDVKYKETPLIHQIWRKILFLTLELYLVHMHQVSATGCTLDELENIPSK